MERPYTCMCIYRIIVRREGAAGRTPSLRPTFLPFRDATAKEHGLVINAGLLNFANKFAT